VLRRVLGTALGLVAALWLRTLRLTVHADPALGEADADARPWVLAFLHGKLWALLAWPRRRRTAALVSRSADGELFGAALAAVGLTIVRGSSSRGGAEGLGALVRLLRRGPYDAAVAVDGPRGPRGEVKPGAAAAARLAGGVVVPMGSAAVGPWLLRSWDRFELAWPFSRVAVVLGPPLAAAEADPARLGAAIDEANVAASRILSSAGVSHIGSLGASEDGW
jgi:hypothetical protein